MARACCSNAARRRASGGGLLVPPEGEPAAVLSRLGLQPAATFELAPLRHAFTHFRLLIRPLVCRLTPPAMAGEDGLEWLEMEAALEAGVPTPVRRLIRQLADTGGR